MSDHKFGAKKRSHDATMMKKESPCFELFNTDAPHLSELSLSLANFVYPLSTDDFMLNYFRQRAICVHSSCDRITPLVQESFSNLDVDYLFKSTASDNVFIWLGKKNEDPNKRKKQDTKKVLPPLQSVEIENPDAATALHNAGHAAYCRAPLQLDRRFVDSFLQDTGLGLGCYNIHRPGVHDLSRGEVEMFFGIKGHITDWHFDFQDNFTIQLSGKKKWTLCHCPVRHPLRGHTPHYESHSSVVENQLKAARLSIDSFEFTPPSQLYDKAFTQEVILNAGDVFYFPAGMWHKVESLESGVSMNISLMSSSWADLTATAVRHILHKLPVSSTPLYRPPGSTQKNDILLQSAKRSRGIKESKGSELSDTLSCKSSNVRSTALLVLNELKAAVNEMTVEDILPYVLSHPLREDAEEEDAEEEEDEEECFDLMSIPLFREVEAALSVPFRLNPLALLFREKELTDYYESFTKNSDKNDNMERNKFIWLLHINYGNDGLQSLIRKRLFVSSTSHDQLLAKLWGILKHKQDLSNEENPVLFKDLWMMVNDDSENVITGASVTTTEKELKQMVGALIYFGLFSPIFSTEIQTTP